MSESSTKSSSESLTQPARTTTRRVIASIVAALVVVGVAAFRVGPTVADPDLWGHVLNGLDTLTAGGYIGVDDYSYLSGEQPWINHHWLGDLIMGATYSQFGSAGLVFLKAFVALGIVSLLVWLLLRAGLEPIRAALVGVLLVAVLTPTFGTFRPQLFTVLCALVLLLVMVEVERGRIQLLWILPPLFVGWANLHGGFLAGLAILGLWSVIHALRSHGPRRLWPLAAFGGSVVAAMITPNGWRLLQFLVETATVPRPEIQDWQPIDLGSVVGVVYVVLVGIVVAALAVDRRRLNPALVIPLVGLLIAPLLAWRHLQLLVVAVVVLGASHLARLSERITPGETAATAKSETLRTVGVVLSGVVVTASLGFGSLSSCIRVDASQFEFPQRAAATWASLDPAGNTVVPFNWGEYMRWQFGPDVQVSTDGRRETVYSEEVHRANLNFLNGTDDWDDLLQMAPADWIFIPSASPAVALVSQSGDWHQIYHDPVATIFATSEVPVTSDSGLPTDGDGSCFPASFAGSRRP